MKKNMERILTKWMRDTSIHGLSKIYLKKNLTLKIIWASAFLMSVVVCVYFVFQNVSRYLSGEIITRVQVLQEIPVIFPRVTICNFNPFVTNFSTTFLNDVRKNNSFQSFDLSDRRSKSLVLTAAAMNLRHKDRKKLGYSIEEFFISCKFLTIDCNFTEFIEFYHLTHGNCFIFNSGTNYKGEQIRLKTVNRASLKGALSIELFVGNDLINGNSMGTGAVIFLSNHSESPFENSGYFLAASFLSSFQISRIFNYKLGEPFSKCYEPVNNDFSVEFESVYSQAKCKDMCSEEFFVHKCRCYDPQYASRKKVRQCQSFNDFKCIQAANTEFASCNLLFNYFY